MLRRVSVWLIAALIGAALALVLLRLSASGTTALLAAAITAAALGFCQQRYLEAPHHLRLVLGEGELGVIDSDAPIASSLPELRRMRRYLGLTWLENSEGHDILIWPDMLSADDARVLRVWLGIHAR
jgi:hypothetical protein